MWVVILIWTLFLQAFQMSNLIREYMEKIVEGREKAKIVQNGTEMMGVMATD